MNTKIRLALCALGVFVPAWVAVRAGDLTPAQKTGKVLVLDTERTLEGDIERQGEQYRVRRSLGELWVQRENVLRLCRDYPEAYAFLRTRANLRDPDEHLRLARWCQLHGLKNEALLEVTEAVRLRPQHAESQRLLRSLQRTALINKESKSTPTTQEADTAPTAPAVDTESLSVYVTRIQPLLMNACASCHTTGRGGAFKLTRTFENSLTNRKITLQNLAAVLARVSPEQPQASALLQKAVSVHGDMAQPALKGREAPAYRTLENWVLTTLENNPQLHEQPGQAAPASAQVTKARSAHVAFASDRPTALTESAKAAEIPATPHDGGAAGKVLPPATSTEPVDPFDPLIFNRQAHPQKVEGAKQ
jgi:hypothetical protein